MYKFFQSVSAQVNATAASYKTAPKVEVTEIADETGEPKPWVDGPIKLIKTPATYLDIKAHYGLHIANEMAIVHNIFFRGFNAVLVQGPHVPDFKVPKYSASVTTSFLIFVRSLLRAVHHHHNTEETTAFPAIEREIGQPGFLLVASEQHKTFHDGMEKLEKYVDQSIVHPEDYRWQQMKNIIDEFLPALEAHLREEIDLMLRLKEFPEKGLDIAMGEFEKKAQEGGTAQFFDVIPIYYGCNDREYDNGSGAHFPPAPEPVRWAIMYWYGKRYQGSWRFCPCDFYSKPRPLQFVGGPNQPRE